MARASKTTPRKKNNLTKIGIFVPIIVATISCIAAVAGTEPFASWMVTLLPAMATPTPSALPTDSPTAPATGVVTKSPPTIQTSTSYAPGEDWAANCIGDYWIPYPYISTFVENGCLQQPIWDSISTKDGGLYIFAEPSGLIGTKEYGIFIELPQNASVRMNIDFDKVENGQVWVAILGEQALTAEGVIIVAPPGDVTERAFAIKDSRTQLLVANSRFYKNPLGIYSLGFDISNGVITALVENEPIKTVSFSSPRRWLFIGYRANLDISLGTADVQALFSGLEIK